MPKKQISIRIDKEFYDELIKNKDQTGISVSKQIELLVKGYKIVKIKKGGE